MDDCWWTARKELPGGLEIIAFPLNFGKGRLGIGRTGSGCFDKEW